MSFLKLWSQFFQELVAILVIPRLPLNIIYLLQSWCRIFVALSFFELDTEGDLWRDCYSSLILRRLTILLTVCVRTVKCILWVFLECLSANKSLRIFEMWLFSVRFSLIVKPSSFHSVTLSSTLSFYYSKYVIVQL